MNTSFEDNRQVFIQPIGKILGMGGPWVGTLVVDSQVYPGRVLVDSLLMDDAIGMIYTVRYFPKYWRNDCFFKIQAVSLINGQIFLSREHYVALHLVEAQNGNVVFCKSFSKHSSAQTSLAFNEQNFPRHVPETNQDEEVDNGKGCNRVAILGIGLLLLTLVAPLLPWIIITIFATIDSCVR